ncbi:MAG: GGDEF domain-containing protein [Elusimicrobiota bacterium]
MDNLVIIALVGAVICLGFLGAYYFFPHFFEGNQKWETEFENLKQELLALKNRHEQLKIDVQKNQTIETQSLQIYAVAKSLAEALSWAEMAPRLTNGIQKIFGAYEFLLYAAGSHGQWNLIHRRGNWAKVPPITDQVPSEPKFYHPPQIQELVPVLTAPIFSENENTLTISGVLFLKPADKGQDQVELLETAKEFGEELGVAINKALLFSKMEEHSKTDGLTGLLRRQAFMDRLNEEFKRASAFHTSFSLLMVDIDHFKAVNDSHGHGAGDAVLSRVGQILKESFYETDVVGRYGGEEFIVLLPRAEAEGVYRKAESLRKRIEQEIISSGFTQLKVTVSIGLSHYHSGINHTQLIEAADKALYRAKESGRNRVIAA